MKTQNLKQKIWNTVRWFVPFYGTKDKAIEESTRKSVANAIGTAILFVATGMPTGAYVTRAIGTRELSWSKQRTVYAQRSQEQQHISELRNNLSSHIDQNKDGAYSVAELSDFCEKTGQDPLEIQTGYRLPIDIGVEELERFNRNYESEWGNK